MKKTDAPIIVEAIYKTSKEKVWHAITNVVQMRQWFFEQIEAFEPKVGFETQFPVRSEERVFTHQWRVTEVIPFQKIKYKWAYEEYDGDSFVVFDLIEEKDGVKLKLTTIVLEDFPSDIPEFARESCIGGWNYFLKERLKAYLS